MRVSWAECVCLIQTRRVSVSYVAKTGSHAGVGGAGGTVCVGAGEGVRMTESLAVVCMRSDCGGTGSFECACTGVDFMNL